jgi:hypothetical protein
MRRRDQAAGDTGERRHPFIREFVPICKLRYIKRCVGVRVIGRRRRHLAPACADSGVNRRVHTAAHVFR